MRKILLLAILCFLTIIAQEEIVVRILGGARIARLISEEMGYRYKGPVSGIRLYLIDKHLK